jgi:hypothetical protein
MCSAGGVSAYGPLDIRRAPAVWRQLQGPRQLEAIKMQGGSSEPTKEIEDSDVGTSQQVIQSANAEPAIPVGFQKDAMFASLCGIAVIFR